MSFALLFVKTIYHVNSNNLWLEKLLGKFEFKTVMFQCTGTQIWFSCEANDGIIIWKNDHSLFLFCLSQFPLRQEVNPWTQKKKNNEGEL